MLRMIFLPNFIVKRLELEKCKAHHETKEFYRNWKNAKTETAKSYWRRRYEVEIACIPHLEEEIKKFNTGEYNLIQDMPRI